MAEAEAAEIALVTGGAGAVGARVVKSLQARGWRVRGLEHRRPVPQADEALPGDLARLDTLERAARDAAVVVHLAAVTHARRARLYYQANLDGTRRLLEAARRAGVGRFVHVSTRAISTDGGAYSESKALAEGAVRESGLAYTIVRLPEVYGGGGTEGVDRIVELAREGKPIPLVGRGSDEVCPVHVDDAVEALASAASNEKARGKTYTLAGECMTTRELAVACQQIFGTEGRLVNVPPTLVAAAGSLGRLLPLPVYPDQLARLRATKPGPSDDAAEELGFRPRSLQEGLRAMELD